MGWVLKSRSQYFRDWTIGPRATGNIREAACFATREEALSHPAYYHWSSDYEPYKVKDKPKRRKAGR